MNIGNVISSVVFEPVESDKVERAELSSGISKSERTIDTEQATISADDSEYVTI